MVIHRLIPIIEVHTKLEKGICIAWIDMSETVNTIWKVRLQDGTVRNFYDTEIMMYENQMNNEPKIKIPASWKK